MKKVIATPFADAIKNIVRSAAAVSLLVVASVLGCHTPAPRPARANGSLSATNVAVTTGQLDGTRWLARDAEVAVGLGANPLQVAVTDIAGDGDRVGGFVTVPLDQCMLAYARGSQGIEDLDLYAYSDDGTTLAADEASDPQPAIIICPPHPARAYLIARVAAGKHHGAGGHLERSIAGAVLLSQCGAARDAFIRLAIELRVARSAVETVIAIGEGPAIPIAEALPQRASGPIAPLADPGPRSPLEPIAVRAKHAEQRVKNMGPTSMHTQVFSAEPDGTGREVLRLEEGCHRVELFAELLGRSPIDLDAELREAATERLMARDRSDASDVRLDFCAGTTTAADLLFAGAPGPVPVLLMDSLFALPQGVPTIWGARARGGLAAALWRRRMPPVETDPIEQRLGVAGLTSMAISIEPGQCYVMAIAAMRGDPRSLTLSARVDTRVTFDSSAGVLDGSALAFCSGGAEKAYVEAEVRGSAVAWVLAVWQLGTRPFDEGR